MKNVLKFLLIALLAGSGVMRLPADDRGEIVALFGTMCQGVRKLDMDALNSLCKPDTKILTHYGFTCKWQDAMEGVRQDCKLLALYEPLTEAYKRNDVPEFFSILSAMHGKKVTKEEYASMLKNFGGKQNDALRQSMESILESIKYLQAYANERNKFVQTFRIDKISVDGNSAAVAYSVQGKFGPENGTVQLVKENNKWLITEFIFQKYDDTAQLPSILMPKSPNQENGGGAK